MPITQGESHQYLHSFCLHPNVRFQGQGDDEQVVLVLRAHPITQLGWIFQTMVLFMFLFLVNLVLPSFFNLRQIFFVNIAGLF